MASNDNDLRRQLKQFGVDVGPITDTTRDLYKRKLQKLSKTSKVSRGGGSSAGRSARPGNSSSKTSTSNTSRIRGDSTVKNIGSLSQRTPVARQHVKSRESSQSRPVASGSSNSRLVLLGASGSNDSRCLVHSGKRSASGSSYQIEPKRPRLEHYDESRSKNDSEEEMEITIIQPGDSTQSPKPTVASSPRFPRLYPTLPEDVDGESSLPPSQPSVYVPPPASPPVRNKSHPQLIGDTNRSNPSPKVNSPPNCTRSGSNSSFSPPSPTPSVDRSGGGFVSTVTGFIGAGMRKIVNQIQGAASPRPPIASRRHKRKVSFGSRSPSADSQASSRAPHMGSTPRRDSIPIGEVDLGEMSPPVSPLSDPEEASSSQSERNRSGAGNTYDWELMPSDVEICKKADGSLWRLGKGGFGEVFKGLKDSVDEVAVKVIRIQNTPLVAEQFKQEIDIISKLRHRHILQFYGACIQPNCLYMVTELMQTDLFSNLRHDIRYLWTGVYGKDILIGVASGLHYLHSRKPSVVHRDIKSPNILLMDGIAKIADVGIARTKSDSDMTAQKGYTIAWAAPEVVYRKRATEKIDIWSYGVIIWEVVSGKMPRVGHLELSAQAPHLLRTLYTSCVSDDPSQRPSAADVVKQLKAIK